MRYRSAVILAMIAFLGGSAALASAQSTQPTATLLVGAPAPAFAVEHWYKGKPFTAFRRGRVYVVEFWATWCGPCKENIPHLTELQHEYADRVTIVGVDISERPDELTEDGIVKLVQPFVDKMGDGMDYAVAGDGVAQTMRTTWLHAAGQHFIPTAFLVGGDGVIDWIGQPDKMKPALDDLLSGRPVRTAEPVQMSKPVKSKEILDTEKLFEISRNKDPKAMQTQLDVLVADNPEGAKTSLNVVAFQMQIYLLSDAAASLDYARRLTADGSPIAGDPNLVAAMLYAMPKRPTAIATVATLKSLAAICEPAVEKTSTPHTCYFMLAELENTAGNSTAAATYQQRGIDVLKKPPTSRTPPPERRPTKHSSTTRTPSSKPTADNSLKLEN